MANKQSKKKSAGKSIQSYATPALDKGLDVIELLAGRPSGLTMSQVARELNRTVSEIFRMLICLERRGYISQNGEERYSLTLKLFKLIQEHPPIERLIADALPIMHRLAHNTDQSCHLGVLEGSRVVILAQENASTNIGFYVKLGSTVDLMEAGSGYVILAHLDEVHLNRALAEWTRESGKKPTADLEAHLSRIRKAGYEKQPSFLVKGVVNISFPILDERRSAVGALTVPFIEHVEPTRKVTQIIESLRNAAAEITATIGGRTA